MLKNENDPVKRLHNLCNAIQEQQDESPYSAGSWDKLDAENLRLRGAIHNATEKIIELERFIEKAFIVYPDLDIDIDKDE